MDEAFPQSGARRKGRRDRSAPVLRARRFRPQQGARPVPRARKKSAPRNNRFPVEKSFTSQRGDVMQIQPYLFFEGRTEEAIEFYKKAVGAKVEMLMRYSEAPDKPPPGMIPPGSENKVMHSRSRSATRPSSLPMANAPERPISTVSRSPSWSTARPRLNIASRRSARAAR